MDDLQHSIKALNLEGYDKPKSIWQRISYWYWDNVWRALPYSVRDKYYNVRDYFFPRHRWLTKKVPNGWRDKDTIIEICLFECLKHFVEEDGEDAFNVLCCDNPEGQAKFMTELKAMYQSLTVTLPALEQKEKEAWDRVPHRSFRDINKSLREGEYEQMYGEVNRLEKEIEDLKTSICEWVVKNRQDMWT